ncbi:protein of unknown function (plasmid) [Azospirillum lipoferum 4B]|uniref:Uncharacterized protein n=1 Tax=Azospirillum lipoferum (strain 4B) TaxID=862719 RepID=G7ZIK7_AZOL4|nr:protein of unknown function [Azospirillum lipoferum 4B]
MKGSIPGGASTRPPERVVARNALPRLYHSRLRRAGKAFVPPSEPSGDDPCSMSLPRRLGARKRLRRSSAW